MSAEDEIRGLLEREPYLFSKEIAEVFGNTQRHVRRVLSLMPDVVCERRGRGVVYFRKCGCDASADDGSSSSAAITTTLGNRTFCGAGNGAFAGRKGYVSGGDSVNMGHFSHLGSVLGKDFPYFFNRGGKSHCNDTFPASSDCPFVFGSLERDGVGFVVLDEFFRNLLLSHARRNAWDVILLSFIRMSRLTLSGFVSG